MKIYKIVKSHIADYLSASKVMSILTVRVLDMEDNSSANSDKIKICEKNKFKFKQTFLKGTMKTCFTLYQSTI